MANRSNNSLQNEIDAMKNSPNGGDAALNEVLSFIGSKVKADRVFMLLRNSDNTYTDAFEFDGTGVSSFKEAFASLSDGEVYDWKRVTAGKPYFVCANLEQLAQDRPHMAMMLSSRGVKRLAISPLFHEEQDYGFLVVNNYPEESADMLRELLPQYAKLLSFSVAERSILNRLISIGYLDKVTRLGNRNACYEFAEGLNKGLPLGLLYADVSRVRLSNDPSGKYSGEGLIAKVAGIFADAFGASRVFRFSADEFVCFYSGEEEAFVTATDHLKTRLEEKKLIVYIGRYYEESYDKNFNRVLSLATSDMANSRRAAYTDKAKNSSIYDSIAEVHLKANYYKVLFSAPTSHSYIGDGVLTTRLEEDAKNGVHPDDLASFRSFWDFKTLVKRLEEEKSKSLVYNFRGKLGDLGSYVKIAQTVLLLNNDEEETILMLFTRILKKKEKDEILARKDNIEGGVGSGLLSKDDFLEEAVKVADAGNEIESRFAISLYSVNFFTLYNEIFGKDASDKLLNELGNKLLSFANERNGIAGYLGGSSYVTCIPLNEISLDDFINDSKQLLESSGLPYGFSLCAGVATGEGQDTISEIYDRAEETILKVKDSFTNHFAIFDTKQLSQLKTTQAVLLETTEGLAKKEFLIYLQPKVDLNSGKIVSSEALVRWRHNGELVSPGRFIPAMESSGYIYALDRFVWEEVFKLLRKRIDEEKRLLPISINVSRIDLYFTDVAAYLETMARRYNIDPRFCEVEIAEAAFVDDKENVNALVTRLKAKGFVVFMDNFGHRNTSLDSLKTISIDSMKLDRHFIANSSGGKAKAVVESIVTMGHMLGLPIVAEGVETAEQRNALLQLGCDYGQGYFFYKPLPVEEFEALIDDPENVVAKNAASRNVVAAAKMKKDEELSARLAASAAAPCATFALIRNDEGEVIDLEYAYVNDAFEALSKLHRDEILGLSLSNIIPEFNKEWLTRAYDACVLEHFGSGKEYFPEFGANMVFRYGPSAVRGYLSVSYFPLPEDEK